MTLEFRNRGDVNRTTIRHHPRHFDIENLIKKSLKITMSDDQNVTRHYDVTFCWVPFLGVANSPKPNQRPTNQLVTIHSEIFEVWSLPGDEI